MFKVSASDPMRLQTASTGLGYLAYNSFLKLTPMVRLETAPTGPGGPELAEKTEN